MRVGELAILYLSNHLRFRPSFLVTRRLVRVTFPPIAYRELEALTPAVLLAWRTSLADTPSMANKAVSLLRTVVRWGRQMQLHTCPTPTEGLRPLPEYARERVLSAEERRRLVAVLEDASPKPRAYFFLLLLCGPRLSECRLMRWADVDLTTGLWRKPAHTTKARRPHLVPLPSQAVALLAGLPRLGDWVFPGYRWDRPWAAGSIRIAWRRIRQAAQVPDVSIHDLRRSCATELNEAGLSVATIQQVLGHSSLEATQRYIHPCVGTVRAGLQARADGVMAGRP